VRLLEPGLRKRDCHRAGQAEDFPKLLAGASRTEELELSFGEVAGIVHENRANGFAIVDLKNNGSSVCRVATAASCTS
jgi:hypothetical protein